MFVPALEIPDNVRVVFNSSVPWRPGRALVAINGRPTASGFIELSSTTIQFDNPPGSGDVVGFLVVP